MTLILGDNMEIPKPNAATNEPTRLTARQPNLLIKAPAMGAAQNNGQHKMS